MPELADTTVKYSFDGSRGWPRTSSPMGIGDKTDARLPNSSKPHSHVVTRQEQIMYRRCFDSFLFMLLTGVIASIGQEKLKLENSQILIAVANRQ